MLAGFTNLTETLLLTGIQTFRGFTQRLKLPPFPSALHGRFTGEAPILGGQARKPATHHPPITAAIEPRAKSLNQMFGKMPTLEKYRTRSTTWDTPRGPGRSCLARTAGCSGGTAKKMSLEYKFPYPFMPILPNGIQHTGKLNYFSKRNIYQHV